MWQTLKQILPNNARQGKLRDPPTNLCDPNNTSLENPTEIAESFNT